MHECRLLFTVGVRHVWELGCAAVLAPFSGAFIYVKEFPPHIYERPDIYPAGDLTCEGALVSLPRGYGTRTSDSTQRARLHPLFIFYKAVDLRRRHLRLRRRRLGRGRYEACM